MLLDFLSSLGYSLTRSELMVNFSIFIHGLWSFAVPGGLHGSRIARGTQVKEWSQKVTLSTPLRSQGVKQTKH